LALGWRDNDGTATISPLLFDHPPPNVISTRL